MDFANPSRRRLLRRKRDRFWLTVGLCALTAALIFLPFQIIDGGFFHYAGDFNGQQIGFYRYMNGFVKGQGYPDGLTSVNGQQLPTNTFSWATDLGSGVMNAYSFYLYGSPFFWLSTLFPQSWMPYLMCPLLVLKFAVAGGGSYLYLRRYVKNLDYAVLGACLYTFSGFGLYNIFFNHFIDVLALFPWMLWALDACIYDRRRGLFAFFVAINLLNNYFFFVGQVVFLIIYFVCKVTTGEIKLTRSLFGTLAFESLLGVAMGCLLVWPAFLSLMQNPRTTDVSSGWGFLTYSKVQQYLAILVSWLLPPDSPYIVSIWSEGTIKWTSMTAYLPLCSLAGAIAYWRARQGDSRKRIIAVCALFALVPVLNSAFYAFNASYYARWYYMPVLILAAMTVNAWEDDTVQLERPAGITAWLMIATLAFALVPVDNGEDGWSLGVLENPEQYLAVLGFGLVGLAIYGWLIQHRADQKRFCQQMLAAVLAFSCIFGCVHIGIGKFGQWNYDSDLVDQYQASIALQEAFPEGDWRVDTYNAHDNLGLWMDKSCLQFFDSTVAPSILRFYSSLGFTRDVRSNPDVCYYALRGLLSVRFTVMPEDQRASFEEAVGAGWTYYGTVEGMAVYENDNYLPMGFTYDYYVSEDILEGMTTQDACCLLVRVLALSEEDIAKYGQYLTPAPDSVMTNFTYEQYVQDVADRRETTCSDFMMTNSGFSAEIQLERDNLVFFSVPYDDGFTAYVNGQEAEILQVDNGMMAVLCPAGWNNIDFVYSPAGLSLSRTVTLIAIPIWLVYTGYFFWKRRKTARR